MPITRTWRRATRWAQIGAARAAPCGLFGVMRFGMCSAPALFLIGVPAQARLVDDYVLDHSAVNQQVVASQPPASAGCPAFYDALKAVSSAGLVELVLATDPACV